MGLAIYFGDSIAQVLVDGKLVWNSYADAGVLVGYPAVQARHPTNTIFGLRRLLGKKYDEVIAEPMFHNCPFSIINNSNDEFFKIKIELTNETLLVTPVEVAQHLFTQLYEDAKNMTGEEHKSVVVAVPAYFNDAQRQATKDVGTLAGLNVIRVTNETSATILTFPEIERAAYINLCLVVKIGSYETTVSLAEVEEGIVDIKGCQALPFGGDKLDQILAEYFIQTTLKEVPMNFNIHHRLLRHCRRLKCTLSKNPNASIEFSIGDVDYNLELSRPKFENLIKGVVDDFIQQLHLFCQTQNNFQHLLLVGGSAHIPLLQTRIESALSLKAKVVADPSEVICNGIGILARLLTGPGPSLCGTYNFTYQYPVPNRAVKASGLYDNNSEGCIPIPLTHASVNVEVLDFLAKVSVTQSFLHEGASPVEAVYLWPVDSRAAVSGFRAKVGDKEYQGIIKEKHEAFAVYDQAISESHGAFLMEKVAGDIFQINLGNLQPNTPVTIYIDYVTLLTCTEGSKLTFSLPTIVSSPYPLFLRYTPHSHIPEYDTKLPSTSHVPTSLSIGCRASSPIHSISSPSHAIDTLTSNSDESEKREKRVVMREGQLLDTNFVLHIHLESPLSQVAWISSSPEWGPPAALISIPSHPLPEKIKKVSNEFVFLIDRSGSMYDRIDQAKTALLLFIKSLPQNSFFRFGSTFEKLFPTSKPYTEEHVSVALKALETLAADLGGTEILEPIVEILKAPVVASRRHVLLVTDGEVSNTDEVVQHVLAHKGETQVHTLGIGASCSRYLICEAAKAGGGGHDFVSEREPIGPKVIGLLKACAIPQVTETIIEYSTSDNRIGKASIKSSYLIEDKRLCFALLDPQVFPPAQFKISTILGGDPDAVQSTTSKLQPTNFYADNLVQLMTAHAQLQNLELSVRSPHAPEYKTVLELSLAYRLMSKVASYVIVEKRSEAVQDTMEKAPEAIVRKSGQELYLPKTSTRSHTHDLLLLDVTPLDVDFTDGQNGFVTVIQRNCKRYQVVPGATAELGIYEHKSNCLGSVPVPVGNSTNPTIPLNVTFDIDANGILNVVVENMDSGVTEKRVFTNDKGRLSKEQIEALISASDPDAPSTYNPTGSQLSPENNTMIDLVRLQKLNGLWALDESFVTLFGENSAKIRTHPNLATIRSFGVNESTAEILWATALAVAFFHSAEMVSMKPEWELLVDKSLESLQTLLSDANQLSELFRLGEQGITECPFPAPPPKPTNSQPTANSSQPMQYTSPNNSSYGPTVEEVD